MVILAMNDKVLLNRSVIDSDQHLIDLTDTVLLLQINDFITGINQVEFSDTCFRIHPFSASFYLFFISE